MEFWRWYNERCHKSSTPICHCKRVSAKPGYGTNIEAEKSMSFGGIGCINCWIHKLIRRREWLLTVQFNDKSVSVGGEISNWDWDFGDGGDGYGNKNISYL